MALDKVSKRELKEIDFLIDMGLSDKELAFTYEISERTVYAIRRNRYNINHWDDDDKTSNID